MINIWWCRSSGLAPKLNSFILQWNTCLCVITNAAPYCKVQFSLSDKIQIPFPQLCGRGTDVLSIQKSFLPSYIFSLYFQVMHPQTLQSQLARVYCFDDTSPSHSHLMLRIITLHHTCQLEVTDLRKDCTQGLHIFSTAIAVMGPSGPPVHHTRHGTLTHSFPYNLPSPSTNWFCTLCGPEGRLLSTMAVLPKAGQWPRPRDIRSQKEGCLLFQQTLQLLLLQNAMARFLKNFCSSKDKCTKAREIFIY